jgi:ubiquinone/menaquinone biosynthesis C-methylase UbiE
VALVARVDYGGWMASAYDRGRGLGPAAVAAWEAAATPFLRSGPDGPVLDLGAGTGRFSGLLAAWSGRRVVAVEPAGAMATQAGDRARDSSDVGVVVGGAESIPLREGSVGVAWLSQVIHHIPDLGQAARELARVVRAGGHVLLRGSLGREGSSGGGAGGDYVIYHYFPAAGRVADGFPNVGRVTEAFGSAGFEVTLTTKVAQPTTPSLRSLYERTVARADSTLAAIDDDDFAAGLDVLRRDAEAAPERAPTPVIDHLDFVVLRSAVRA